MAAFCEGGDESQSVVGKKLLVISHSAECSDENEASPLLINEPNLRLADSVSDTDGRISREMWGFRLRYLFHHKQPINFACHCRNFPTGTGVYLLLLLNFLERLAYYQILFWVLAYYLECQNLSPAKQALIQALVYNVFGNFLYPIAGVLADAWIGRYTAVHGSLWVLLTGYIGVAFISAFGVAYSEPLEALHYKFLLPLMLVLICVGTAGFQANVIPYGADQIAYGSSAQVSSYFYWYYWSRNLGLFLSNYISFLSCSDIPDHLFNTLVPGTVAAVSIAAALTVLYLLRHWLQIYQEKTNPWRKITHVLYNVARARRPSQRSAFSYAGRDPPSRFDLAKQVHGGGFSNEDVEDVKSFLRLLVVLLAIGGSLTAFSGVTSVFSVQSKHMAHSYANFRFNSSLGTCSVSGNTYWLVNSLTILVVLPILNQFVFPCLREYTPSLLKRIGIGYILSAASLLILMILIHAGQEVSNDCLFSQKKYQETLRLSSWLLLVPLILISLSEVFVNLSSFEFFCAQSPHNMRGMMIGLFFFTQGLFSSFAALLLFVFSDSRRVSRLSMHHSGESCTFWYYLILFLVAMVTFVLYIIVSCKYRKRERGDVEDKERFYRDIQ